MASIYSASIDLSLIDKSKITEKNGKKYYNIQITLKDEADQYGQILSITENQSKEEREAKTNKKYLGNGKLVFDSNANNLASKPVAPVQSTVIDELDTLPF
jgi:hypothetical protein